MLEDIRTVEENEFAGDQICDIVRELTKDSYTIIHASAAGGRKTMSIYLTAAMQMYGRAQDALSACSGERAVRDESGVLLRTAVAANFENKRR